MVPLHEADDAAAEPRARESGTERRRAPSTGRPRGRAPGSTPRSRRGGSAWLASMERSEPPVRPARQRVGEREHPGVLRDHVAGARVVTHLVLGGVAECGDADPFRGRLAPARPFGVRAADERRDRPECTTTMPSARAGGDRCDRERAAVEEQRVTRAAWSAAIWSSRPPGTPVAPHSASWARRARRDPVGARRRRGRRTRRPARPSSAALDERPDPDGHRRGDREVVGSTRMPAAVGQAATAPATKRPHGGSTVEGSVEPSAATSTTPGSCVERAQDARPRRRVEGDPDLPVDRHRQAPAVLVVGVVADQVHPAGACARCAGAGHRA